MTNPLFAETDEIIRGWARTEIGGWQLELSKDDAERRIRFAALQDGSICVIRIDAGNVSLDPEITAAWPYLANTATAMGYRAALYLEHLRTAFTTFGMTGSGLVGVYLNDIYPDTFDAPIFCFQKRRGSRGMLLPDVDFLSWKYYLDEQNRYVDRTSFFEKADEAIFVGSTTGDVVLTAAHVQSLSNARLRAAVHFRGQSRIIFHLPQIVQCDGAETEALVRALDVAGRRWSWEEQLGFRYLLSLDGNGATCSRVALGLASNSALLKYESPYQLYYFQGLKPWKHYIPVLTDHDVELFLRYSPEWAASAANVAASSSEFSARFLSRLSVLRYTAEIMALYLEKFGEPRSLADRGTFHLIDVFAHVADHGSVWGKPGEWLSTGRGQTAIEGVSLMPAEQIAHQDLSYTVVDVDGALVTGNGGEFCGSYNANRPLHGFGATLSRASARRFSLAYQLRFADGYESAPTEVGTPMIRQSPITDIRIALRERGSSPWWRFGLRTHLRE